MGVTAERLWGPRLVAKASSPSLPAPLPAESELGSGAAEGPLLPGGGGATVATGTGDKALSLSTPGESDVDEDDDEEDVYSGAGDSWGVPRAAWFVEVHVMSYPLLASSLSGVPLVTRPNCGCRGGGL